MELIHEEMQFLLQRNSTRFKRELTARLLEEGCNMPAGPAKSLFYTFFLSELKGQLSEEGKARFSAQNPADISELDHPSFCKAVTFLKAKIKKSETNMVQASLSAVESIIDYWQLDPALFGLKSDEFDQGLLGYLHRVENKEMDQSQAIGLTKKFRHRVVLALTMSLYRHVRNPKDFREKFGDISRIMTAMNHDHDLFNRVMKYYRHHVPYFLQTASRIFWRCLHDFLHTPDHLR